MNRYKRFLAAGCAVLLAAGALAFTAYGKGPGETAKEESMAAGLKAAEDTDQLVLVVGDGSSAVTVSFHRKEEGRWAEVFSVAGVYGKNGASADKKEGDGKTPLGTYHFTMAFGIEEDPGSVLEYHRLQPTDYWVDDPASRHYNRLVDTRTVKKDWKSAEHMASSSPYYNYGLVLDYNADCVPGEGSAIFLHCTRSSADTGSQGCIRIPEEYVKTLLKTVDGKTKIVIVSDIGQLEYGD